MLPRPLCRAGTCWNGGAAADDASNAALVTHLNRRAAKEQHSAQP